MNNWKKVIVLSGLCSCALSVNAFASTNLETGSSLAGISVALNNYYAGNTEPEKQLASSYSNIQNKSAQSNTAAGSASGQGSGNKASGQSGSASGDAAKAKAAQETVSNPKSSAYDNIAVSKINGTVNIRTEANTSSGVTGKINNDCAAAILDTVDGEGGKWYHIQSGSVTGYIKAQYFATGEEASKIAREVGTTYAKVTNTSTLRLRETPSLEGKTLDLLSADAEYEVIGEEGDFAKISVDNDLVGYVYKDYITTQVDFKQAVSVAEEQQQKAEEEKLKQEANAAIENLEQVKKKAEEESRAAETTAAAKETTAAAKETTKASETSYSGTIEANPSESKAAGTTAAAKETTKAAETKAPTTAAATKATTASGVGPGGGPGTGGTSSSGNEVTNATRSAVVAYAKQFLGNPYVYGGTSLTNGADCSGFTMSVFAHFGISTGRSSRDQAAKGKEVAVSAVQPGDLLFYASGNYINHVALYIGNGQVIHASTAKSGIKISPSNYRTPCKAVSFLN